MAICEQCKNLFSTKEKWIIVYWLSDQTKYDIINLHWHYGTMRLAMILIDIIVLCLSLTTTVSENHKFYTSRRI
jgi:hypothetical protein